MKLKYIPVFAEDIDEQLNFFIEKLGFKIFEKNTFCADLECTIVETGSLDTFLIISKTNFNTSSKSCVILNTDDCLNDYHTLKATGVHFCKEPQYFPIGLVAEFLDPCGNRFILIEERNYNES